MASEYPKMIYSDDGRTHVLQSENADRPEGNWQDQPTDAFLDQQNDHFTTRQPNPTDPHANLIDRFIQRLREEFPSLDRRPPGRPPGSANRPSDGEL